MPTGQTRLGPLAAVRWTRQGPGRPLMTTGDSPPFLICFFVMGARSRRCKSSSGRQGAYGGGDGALGSSEDPPSSLYFTG